MSAIVSNRAWRQELQADIRGYRNFVLFLLLNALACWLMAASIGGSALFSEIPYDGQPFIQVGYDRVPVSGFVYELSWWHGFSVFFSVPCALLLGLVVFGQHGIAWLRLRRPHDHERQVERIARR